MLPKKSGAIDSKERSSTTFRPSAAMFRVRFTIKTVPESVVLTADLLALAMERVPLFSRIEKAVFLFGRKSGSDGSKGKAIAITVIATVCLPGGLAAC